MPWVLRPSFWEEFLPEWFEIFGGGSGDVVRETTFEELEVGAVESALVARRSPFFPRLLGLRRACALAFGHFRSGLWQCRDACES